jgi:molybdopterin synthase sulfur carrier subunit
MIRLVYLARLRDALGTAAESIVLPRDVSTVRGLLAWLSQRGGAWSQELAPGRAIRIAVNHDIAQGDTPIRAGDEVAVFPPVTGG